MPYGLVLSPMALSYVTWACPMSHGLTLCPNGFGMLLYAQGGTFQVLSKTAQTYANIVFQGPELSKLVRLAKGQSPWAIHHSWDPNRALGRDPCPRAFAFLGWGQWTLTDGPLALTYGPWALMYGPYALTCVRRASCIQGIHEDLCIKYRQM